jgi:hypothetical protein
MDIMDIGHGFFMVKFDLEIDREKVISGGPWMVLDHYVAIRPWTTDFISSQVKINKTLVWIRFPSLGMEYYDESLLLALATAVGTPVKVDMHTLDASRGKFARVCIEIELDKPVVGKVWFRDFWYHVEYEGLHLLCKSCGLYGHVARNCPTNPNGQADSRVVVKDTEKTVVTNLSSTPSMEGVNGATETKESDLYGDWLVVNRKKNQGKKTPSKSWDTPHRQHGKADKIGKGSFFSHLNDTGIKDGDGNNNYVWGPSFHPGETTVSPKIWTKTRNKRARGVGISVNEPNIGVGKEPHAKPKKTIMNGGPKPVGLDQEIRVEPSNMWTIPAPVPTKQNTGGEVRFEATKSKSQSCDSHLKPPEPNDASTSQANRNDAAEIDDEMVVETPPSRQ